MNSTRDYVAAAYASIFATTPIPQLENRAIGISELTPTGKDIAAALEAKHGTAPQVFSHKLENINAQVEDGLKSGSLFTLAWYCRKIWGTGQQVKMVGGDIWEVEGYQKATLEDLIIRGKLEAYREMPPQVGAYFEGTF